MRSKESRPRCGENVAIAGACPVALTTPFWRQGTMKVPGHTRHSDNFEIFGHDLYVEWTKETDGSIVLELVMLDEWDLLPVLTESQESQLIDTIEEGEE